MNTPTEQRIALHAISAQQRRLVERHLPLVYLTLRRHPQIARTGPRPRERSELVQEGALALVDAVRNHDPRRHGAFAAYAMARIHFALSRFVHEVEPLIRVPYITQRRRRRNTTCGDRHRPDAPPRVVSIDDLDAPRQRAPHAPAQPPASDGDEVMAHIRRKSTQVIDAMRRSARRPDHDRLLRRCRDERWFVAEPTARTSIRRLARELGCSMGRITHAEKRFHTELAALLRADPEFRRLTGISRTPRRDGRSPTDED